jgi:CxxC motif-containing protein (DUF1111 family)
MGCGSPSTNGLTPVKEDPTDIPLKVASADEVTRFHDGDVVFDAIYLEPDGLGPDYVRNSCAACHQAAAKGPGTVQKMVLVGDDGVTPEADQSELQWGHTVRPYFGGGATMPIMPPTDPHLKMSLRVGVAVFGRGYIEAVDGAEIERVEAEQAQRSDGISGRINRVTYLSQPNPDTRYHQYMPGDTNLIGRFGLKARQPSLDDFAADAAQGDMSITSPLRPTELPNPGGLTDDDKPGVDIGIDTINLLADYMRLLEIPRRTPPAGNGEALFTSLNCAVCHVPTLKTRADYPIAGLAGIDAPIFTDLLLHDMGASLADGMTDGSAGPSEWRTTPLIGLRKQTSYLHDGRAKTVEDAITAHDGEARAAADQFRALSDADRAALIDYVTSL